MVKGIKISLPVKTVGEMMSEEEKNPETSVSVEQSVRRKAPGGHDVLPEVINTESSSENLHEASTSGWTRVQDDVSRVDRQQDHHDVGLRESEASHYADMVRTWPTTTPTLWRDRPQLRRTKKESEDKSEQLNLEKDIQTIETEQAIERAKLMQFLQTERVKKFQSAVLMSKVLKEREAQIEQKKRLEIQAKEEEEKLSALIRENRELALLEERQKAEERRQKGLAYAEFLRQQIKEHEQTREKERMEKKQKKKELKRVQELYEEEETRVHQKKQEKKRESRQAYEEQLADKKILQSSEAKKQEVEREKRKLFVEAKEKQMKLWEEKESERFRDFQRPRDIVSNRLGESLVVLSDEEDEVITRASTDTVAKKERKKKKAALLRRFTEQREAAYEELKRRKQEAAKMRKTNKVADLDHQTQKASTSGWTRVQDDVSRVDHQQDHHDVALIESEASHPHYVDMVRTWPTTTPRAELVSKVVKDREVQTELKQILKIQAEEEEEKLSALIRENRELALLEERQKAEERRQKGLAYAEFLRQQIKEHERTREKELMEKRKKEEELKRVQELYEEEQTTLHQKKQEKKNNIRKAYEEHFADKKILQSSEAKKHEMEREKRKLFVESKDKQLKLWKEKEAERFREIQRYRDIVGERLAKFLSTQSDEEDEVISRPAEHTVARKNEEEHTMEEKKAPEHREAGYEELKRRKQEAAEMRKTNKVADLDHQTQKTKAHKKRNKANLLQDSHVHQPVPQQQDVLPKVIKTHNSSENLHEASTSGWTRVQDDVSRVDHQQDHHDVGLIESEASHPHYIDMVRTWPTTTPSAVLISKVLKEREAQIEQKKRLEIQAKEEEEKLSALIRENRELALLEERQKAEERRQKGLAYAEFLRQQIKEHEQAKQKERMEKRKKQEELKRVLELCKEEETRVHQEKQERKKRIKKSYDKQFADKKILQASEAKKQEMEEEKRMLFVEAKAKEVKRRKEKKAEKLREIERIRDIVAEKLSESLQAKVDDEDERIARAVAEAVAKRDEEKREEKEKKAAMLKSIDEHRKATRKERKHKQQKEKQEAAERLEANKAADLQYHQTEKHKSKKKKEKAKLLQKSHVNQMDEKEAKRQLKKKQKQERKIRNAQLIAEEEAQFQSFAQDAIETARRDQRNISLLQRASRTGIGGGHGPVFDGIRPSYQVQDQSGAELPSYVPRREQDLMEYMQESKKRLGLSKSS